MDEIVKEIFTFSRKEIPNFGRWERFDRKTLRAMAE
jgi:hypothetical protein